MKMNPEIRKARGITKTPPRSVLIYDGNALPRATPMYCLFKCDALELVNNLPQVEMFDLIVTSPPYNLGKEYERRVPLQRYVAWQSEIINLLVPRLRHTGSICWQVGNYVENGSIEPLDAPLHSIFRKAGLQLRNRIVWHFGHGLHCKRRLSGRYEVILWYTKSDEYIFNLDSIRVASKYPGKRSYKGPNIGKLSGNPNGKNPADVWEHGGDLWELPNVKGNHVEKTLHPCQFPVGLIERLVLALTARDQLVFDPFCGVASSGVAAALHGRSFWGCDVAGKYLRVARGRIEDALAGKARYRPHDRPIYDHTRSPLSKRPTS